MILKPCAAVGIPENKDYNGAQQEGAGVIQSTIKNGNAPVHRSLF